MDDAADFAWDLLCPYCGEPAEVDVEEVGPGEEQFVQDCDVCCRPWQVRVTRRSGQPPEIWLGRDDD